jgi:hypothetical protein
MRHPVPKVPWDQSSHQLNQSGKLRCVVHLLRMTACLQLDGTVSLEIIIIEIKAF